MILTLEIKNQQLVNVFINQLNCSTLSKHTFKTVQPLFPQIPSYGVPVHALRQFCKLFAKLQPFFVLVHVLDYAQFSVFLQNCSVRFFGKTVRKRDRNYFDCVLNCPQPGVVFRYVFDDCIVLEVNRYWKLLHTAQYQAYFPVKLKFCQNCFLPMREVFHRPNSFNSEQFTGLIWWVLKIGVPKCKFTQI